MNREIRFRAWSLIHNDMRLNPSLSYKDGKWSLRQKGPSMLEQDDMVLEQFTGLKDKNGTDIYEGDIVKSRYVGYKTSVAFNAWDLSEGEHGVGFCHMREGRVECGIGPTGEQLEVVGNIHQHPELLK